MSTTQTLNGRPRQDVPAASAGPMTPTAAERQEMIRVAPYHRAERRGFAPGGAEQGWLQAEMEIDQLLAAMACQGITREAYERAGLRHALRLWVE